MNKIKQLAKTQDAEFKELICNNGTCKIDCMENTTFIQSSRTALIEEIIQMGEGMKKPICRCMCEENKIAIAHNETIYDLLAPLKEVIDKEHE